MPYLSLLLLLSDEELSLLSLLLLLLSESEDELSLLLESELLESESEEAAAAAAACCCMISLGRFCKMQSRKRVSMHCAKHMSNHRLLIHRAAAAAAAAAGLHDTFRCSRMSSVRPPRPMDVKKLMEKRMLRGVSCT